MIELRKITFDNYDECVKLEPFENQKNFVASNICSLAQAYVALTNNEGIPMPYGIYENDTMVGFIMLSFNEPDEDNEENTYWVWRFMIGKQYQKKGYGKAAMMKALELVRTYPHGEASEIFLSYEPENEVAKALYSSLGFAETGKVEEGELIAKLQL